MRKLLYTFIVSALVLGGASLALADTPPTMGFWCDPYASAFSGGQAYIPTDGGSCNFQMPSFDPSATNIIEIYKGVAGNDPTLIKSIFRTDCSLSFCTMDNVPFGISQPQPGDTYFAVGYLLSSASDAQNYILTGTNPPASDAFQLLYWHWGTPAIVTADTRTITVGASIPTLTATISGFTDGDTLATSGISGAANCTTDAPDSSAPGDYDITCTQGTLASGKYSFTPPTAIFVTGVLHIVAPTPTPTCSLTALPTSVIAGNSSVLTFSSTNATGGSIDNAVGAVSTSGTANVTPSATTLYTGTFTGPGGTTTCSATVTVTPVTPPTDTQPPVITITNPLKNGIYGKNDTVLLTATVTDASPLATTTYWFGNKKINPALPLPLSTVKTPSIQSVSVSAKDIYGNVATSTLKFFVVKNTNSCLLDIISIFILITQDKTFPDKPTIQNLIADCSCFSKGLHRFDDDGHHH